MSIVARFRPLFDRVLIQRVAAESKSKGGILIPETAQEKLNQGTVIAVGQGARTKDNETVQMAVAVGDKVLLPAYGGQDIKLDNVEYQLYRDSDILGVLEN